MGAILEQLGLDQTFFVLFVLFSILFFLLSNTYFKPFLALFQARHKRTIRDREAAEALMAQAQSKFDEYRQRLAEERASARKDFETVLLSVRKEESALLAQAREESKRITQEAAESAAKQRDQIRKQLEADVESLAKSISETLLLR